jgi:hypothetical protein
MFTGFAIREFGEEAFSVSRAEGLPGIMIRKFGGEASKSVPETA